MEKIEPPNTKLTRADVEQKLQEGQRDFRGFVLAGLDLSGLGLQETDLRGADLKEADLRGADLRDADLRGVRLNDAWLAGTNLRGANLSGASLRRAKLHGAALSYADLRGAILVEAYLLGLWQRALRVVWAVFLGGIAIGGPLLFWGMENSSYTEQVWAAFVQPVFYSLPGRLLLLSAVSATIALSWIGKTKLVGADLRGADLRGAHLGVFGAIRALVGGAHLYQAPQRETKITNTEEQHPTTATATKTEAVAIQTQANLASEVTDAESLPAPIIAEFRKREIQEKRSISFHEGCFLLIEALQSRLNKSRKELSEEVKVSFLANIKIPAEVVDARESKIPTMDDTSPSWVFFVDLNPQANWSHECAYVTVKKAVEAGKLPVLAWYPASWPPSDEIREEKIRIEQLRVEQRMN